MNGIESLREQLQLVEVFQTIGQTDDALTEALILQAGVNALVADLKEEVAVK